MRPPHVCECGLQGHCLETRKLQGWAARRRRYVCKCGKRWNTIERRTEGRLTPGRRKLFDRGREEAEVQLREMRKVLKKLTAALNDLQQGV